MNVHILEKPVQEFLTAHAKSEPAHIALKKSPFPAVPASALAVQIDSRQRCEKKLPTWHTTTGIYYPDKTAIEQTSSESTAHYKPRLITPGAKLADLTGGMGIDSYYFSQSALQVWHVERNPELSAIAAHNAHILGRNNIQFIAEDNLKFIASLEPGQVDVIYLDPSRRNKQQKVFLLQDCEPNVVDLHPRLLQLAATVIVKLSPLLDITAATRTLTHVKEIHILSLHNDCKELLFVLERGFTGSPQITVAALTNTAEKMLTFDFQAEQRAVATYGQPKQYLYEPDAALLKSGAFKFTGAHFGLEKLHPHTHLYTADECIPDFLGRVFQVDRILPYGDFKKQKVGLKANVTTRNFPLPAETIRKKHKIGESAALHLFFYKGADENLYVAFTKRALIP